MSLILRLIVSCVEIIHTTLKASLHDCEILIRESHIDTDVRLMTVEKFAKLLNRVCVNLVCGDIRRTDLLSKTVALLLCARSDDDFREYVRILGAFCRHYGSDATGADNHYFSHSF